LAIKLGLLSDELVIAILFHDIVYDPKAGDNEEKSVEILKKYIDNHQIENAILATKTHRGGSKLSNDLIHLDLDILHCDYDTFVTFENKIFKEYQFVGSEIYREKRIEVLRSLNVLEDYIDYVRNVKRNIAVYAGSFNAFHNGHLDILKKGEDIFDKVIIARGINPDKDNELCELPSLLDHHQVDTYDGLLTDYLGKLGHPVTLIRGLRDANDFAFEMKQHRFLEDLDNNIKIVYILGDREYQHVSSSAIRMLKKYNVDGLYTPR